MAAWKHFNTKARNNNAVGIYHETYEITENHYESFYGNMPLYGLAHAMKHTPITANTLTARKRLYNRPN